MRGNVRGWWQGLGRRGRGGGGWRWMWKRGAGPRGVIDSRVCLPRIPDDERHRESRGRLKKRVSLGGEVGSARGRDE